MVTGNENTERNRFVDAIGPVRTSGQVQDALGVSAEELQRLIEERKVLPLETADGVTVFPSFQFEQVTDGRHRVVPGFEDALAPFDPTQVDSWTIAGAFRARWKELDGQTLMVGLKGDKRELALWVARDTAHRMNGKQTPPRTV